MFDTLSTSYSKRFPFPAGYLIDEPYPARSKAHAGACAYGGLSLRIVCSRIGLRRRYAFRSA